MEIKIIETSDMHGYVLPTNYAERNLDLGFSTAKAATIIKKIKAEAKGPVVQIENGDFIQGSPNTCSPVLERMFAQIIGWLYDSMASRK